MQKKQKKRKKSDKTRAKTRCDDLWSKVIRKDGFCEICGTTKNLQAHHVVTRAKLPTRHMLENGVCLCAKHHLFNKDISAHGNSVAFVKWYIEEYGQERLDWLLEQSRDSRTITLNDYLETEAFLNELLQQGE